MESLTSEWKGKVLLCILKDKNSLFENISTEKQSCVATGESHNILYCNDATASPKRLQTAKIHTG